MSMQMTSLRRHFDLSLEILDGFVKRSKGLTMLMTVLCLTCHAWIKSDSAHECSSRARYVWLVFFISACFYSD